MKYFLLSFVAAVALVIGVFGLRGEKFSKPPIEVFPDMDRQDFVQPQEPSGFFHNGMGARLPVAGTVPHASDDGLFPVEFGAGRTGHYHTGAIDDYFATGLPKEELGLKEERDVQVLLRRGQERYAIFCAVCHGESGDGKGVFGRYTNVVAADLTAANFGSDLYPDGQVFHVITHGNGGLMGPYGYNIPVRDRWAIVAYVRALQESKQAVATEEPAPEPAGEGEAEGGEEAAPAEEGAAPANEDAAPAEEETAPETEEAAPAEEDAEATDEEAAAEEETETDNGTTN